MALFIFGHAIVNAIIFLIFKFFFEDAPWNKLHRSTKSLFFGPMDQNFGQFGQTTKLFIF
jgi:hypothetical protein